SFGDFGLTCGHTRSSSGADEMAGRTRRCGAAALMRFGLWAGASALLLAVPAMLSTASLARGPEAVAPIAEELQNTVVNISTTQTLNGSSDKSSSPGSGRQASPVEHLFNYFFDDQ